MPDTISTDVPLVLMATIIDRKYGEKLIEMFTGAGVTLNYLTLAKGTADTKILKYLGLGETEKAILLSKMPFSLSRVLLKRLSDELHKPGHGIAFTLPIDSIRTTKIASHLKSLSHMEGADIMEQSFDHNLIIAVANRGFADDVMDAAKSGGATGGTVIQARGAGLKEAEKFFGVTIQPEKELIMIISVKEATGKIMDAIVKKAGLETDAKAIAFSLPVNGVAGLSSLVRD